MAQPCMGVVIISVVAVIIVFLVILLTTSPQSSHRCPGGVVPWDARNYSNDTTILTCRKLWRRCCSAKSSAREQDVEHWLSEQDTYTLHKPVRRRFQTPLRCSGRSKSTVASSRPSRHVAVEEGQRWNNIHTDCDRCVSKLSWCVPLKNKSVASLVAAFTQLLSNGAPNTLQTDKSTEFLNRSLQKLLKEHGVHHFATHSEETKASIVDRFNRDTEDTYVALFHENPVGSIRRRPAGIYAIVQRHLSPQYRYGSVRSDQYQSGNRVATIVWSRKRRHT